MVPISTGKMHVSFCILYPPQLEFAFSVVDFSLRMSSSLAQGFLKCLSAVLSIHTGILEHSRYVYFAAVLPGSTNLRKLCCKMFKTLTNIRSFFQGIRCVCLEVSNFFPHVLVGLMMYELRECHPGCYFKNIQETV